MNFIKKHLGLIVFLYLTSIAFIFKDELLLPSSVINSEDIIKERAAKRSVLIEWENASWSGIILSGGLVDTKILTIIHNDSMRKINDSADKNIKVSLSDGSSHSAFIESWNSCNELSILTIPNETLSNIPDIILESDSSEISKRLFSFGHPLGLNLHYVEGYLSSKGNKIKPCGMITNGFSGGIIPGQTGSGIWNFQGELSGLIIATSAYPIKVSDNNGVVVGFSAIPITFLGRYIPSSDIRSFLKISP